MKGDMLFKEYWRRPEATAEAFDQEGWFKTGDTAGSQGDPPYWKILGRSSVDIIKSGGYKISALEIENALLTHPAVNECAVVGIEDEVQGQIVAAVVACHSDAEEVGHATCQSDVEEVVHATCQSSCFQCHRNSHKWLCPQIWSYHVMALCSDWLVLDYSEKQQLSM